MCLVFVCGTFSGLCAYAWMCTWQLEKSSLLPCRLRGLNAVVEAPQKSPLPAEPHCQPYFCF